MKKKLNSLAGKVQDACIRVHSLLTDRRGDLAVSTIGGIIIAVVMYFSFALAFWLSNFTGMTVAFLIVGAIHLLIFILFIIFRKPWIEKPLVHFLAGLLLSK